MPISPSSKPIAVLTMGDPSGIGPEIILKSLAEPSIRRLASYIVVGDAKVLQKTAATLSRPHRSFFKNLLVITECPFAFKKRLRAAPRGHISILDLKNVSMNFFSFGKEKPVYGKASVEYIEKAHRLVKTGISDCIITAPISKSAAKRAGFRFAGHTEFLASLCGVKKFVMMLTGGRLRVSLVTRHIPLSEIPRQLTPQNIADTIKITLKALKGDFNITRPKIGVCALNPHSGESGIFGSEEEKIIAPAVRKFRRDNVIGPVSADALFYDAYRGKFDGLICLYHDQGLIPLKMTARDSGVNITLGLPYVRTSPDHGTAFDIAGQGKASFSSMEAAIKSAVSMAANRKTNAY